MQVYGFGGAELGHRCPHELPLTLDQALDDLRPAEGSPTAWRPRSFIAEYHRMRPTVTRNRLGPNCRTRYSSKGRYFNKLL